VEAEPEPEPAAEPPVPTLELLLPPPAEVPPVPNVDAEPLPDPAAEPPVPTLELLVPPPAEVPPVPSVLAEPLPEPPADEPPVPTLELLVPPPADVPPVPTVELDCASASAVPANNVAATTEALRTFISVSSFIFKGAKKTTPMLIGKNKKCSGGVKLYCPQFPMSGMEQQRHAAMILRSAKMIRRRRCSTRESLISNMRWYLPPDFRLSGNHPTR
jgi:hypothetical protein